MENNEIKNNEIKNKMPLKISLVVIIFLTRARFYQNAYAKRTVIG